MKVIKYPLGHSLYAYVNTRQRKTLINIRHFKLKVVKSKKYPKGIQKVVPSSQGISMNLKEFQQLLMISKKICIDYHLKSARANAKTELDTVKNPYFALDEEVNGEREFNQTTKLIDSPSSSSSPPFNVIHSERERERGSIYTKNN